VLFLHRRTGALAANLLAAVFRPFPSGLRQKILTLCSQLTDFQTAGPRFHGIVAGVNALNTLVVGLLIYYFAARAARIEVSIGVLLWVCATVFLLSKIPITVANLGVREVTLVHLLTGYGVNRSEALLMSMILLSSLVFMAALGALYQLLWWAGKGADTVQGPDPAGATHRHRDGENAEESK